MVVGAAEVGAAVRNHIEANLLMVVSSYLVRPSFGC